jgi:DNA-binding transcriptional regulator GbsR (MarR family)
MEFVNSSLTTNGFDLVISSILENSDGDSAKLYFKRGGDLQPLTALFEKQISAANLSLSNPKLTLEGRHEVLINKARYVKSLETCVQLKKNSSFGFLKSIFTAISDAFKRRSNPEAPSTKSTIKAAEDKIFQARMELKQALTVTPESFLEIDRKIQADPKVANDVVYLDLSNSNIKSYEVQIVAFIKKCPKLRYINLSNTEISKDDFGTIKKCFFTTLFNAGFTINENGQVLRAGAKRA